MAIITIGGNMGAGKTVLAAKLAETLNYKELYMGALFREMAKECGMDIETYYAALKSDPSLERAIDNRQEKLMQENDHCVVQGRLAWYFAKKSPFRVINILLEVDPNIGAERVAKRKENAGKSVEEVARATEFRRRTESERFKALYGIENYLAHNHYDIILNTSHLTEEKVLQKILTEINL